MLPLDPFSLDLTPDEIDMLSGGFGDARCMEVLQNGQYDLLHQRLASLLELAPAASTSAATELLRQAHQSDPHAYRKTLLYPYVGVWAAATLDLWMSQAPDDCKQQSLRYLHAVAVAVAARCRVDFEFQLSIADDGSVVIPTYGCAYMANAGDTVLVTCRDGQLTLASGAMLVTVSAHASPEWLPLRTVEVESNGLTLSVVLDDLDPHRDAYFVSGSVPSLPRLDDVAFKTWAERIADAWLLLATHHQPYAVALAVGINVLTPMSGGPLPLHSRPVNGFGAIALTGISSRWIAYALLEEFQRAKLTAVHDVAALYHPRRNEGSYLVPWSPSLPIPFRNYVEAAYSMRAIIEFWERDGVDSPEREMRVNAAMMGALWRARIRDTPSRIMRTGSLTRLGQQFADRFQDVPDVGEERPASPELSPELMECAAFTDEDYRRSLRMQCVAPTAISLAMITQAWLTRADPSRLGVTFETCVPTVLIGWRSRRWLLQRKLADVEWFDEISASKAYLQMIDANADELDAWLARGDTTAVIEAVCQRISSGSATREDWARLAAAHIGSHSPAAQTFAAIPETVFAVHAQLTSAGEVVDPLELAAWMAPVVETTDTEALNRPANA